MTPHIYVVGQTASGKTGFSLKLARDCGFEILNTDSLLFYKDLSVGTAKPSSKDLEAVRHHMVDVCSLGEDLTASSYEKQAKKILKKASLPLLCVGGSGFYIKALDVGLLPLPDTDPQIAKEVEEMKDPVSLLKEVDAGFFESHSANDLYRVKRALQVYKQTGRSLSDWKKDFKPKPYALKLAFAWDRSELFQRVQQRTNMMISEGLIEETEAVLKRLKSSSEWKPLKSVGYLQVLQYLKGDIKTVEELKEEISLRTIQLAKRQKTWFKKDKSVIWFEHKDADKARDFVLKSIEENKWRA